jgi:hypothetical protein
VRLGKVMSGYVMLGSGYIWLGQIRSDKFTFAQVCSGYVDYVRLGQVNTG